MEDIEKPDVDDSEQEKFNNPESSARWETCHYCDLPEIAFNEDELEDIEKPAVDDSEKEKFINPES